MSVSITYPDETRPALETWTRVGIAAGLVACVSYPVLIFVSLPRIAQVTLGASFGPALGIASVALARILRARRPTASVELAAMANLLAGALVTAMIIVQLAINYSAAPPADEHLTRLVVRRLWDVVLGLDVSFDVFIGLGTLLFALNMIRDSRFGPIVGWTGAAIAVLLILGSNFYTFPRPPREAGLVDPGPFTGLWYLAVVILIIRARRRGKPRRLAGAPATT